MEISPPSKILVIEILYYQRRLCYIITQHINIVWRSLDLLYVLSYRFLMGEVGGGGGVNYRMYQANQKYGAPLDMVNIFRDTVLQSPSVPI